MSRKAAVFCLRNRHAKRPLDGQRMMHETGWRQSCALFGACRWHDSLRVKIKKKRKRRTLPEVPIVSAGKRSAQQMNYNWGVMSDSLRVEIY
jgi:hypothetical protein